MNHKNIRIILVDDHQIVRESWRMMLDDNPQFKVVAECRNGREAFDRAAELMPDIILIDINMTPVTGFELAKQLTQQLSQIKIIGMSVHNIPLYARRMMNMGAKGYLTKTSPYDEIMHCIMEVYAGNTYMCNEIVKNTPPSY